MSKQKKPTIKSPNDSRSSVMRQPPVLGRVGEFGYEDPEALPFTIEFHEVLPAPGAPPSLHSFQSATVDSGHWLMIGGRGAPHGATQEQLSLTGEHTFNPSASPHPENFPKTSFNKMIWVYHPVTGEMATFNTHDLPGQIGEALRATSQQSWYDRESGHLWIIGGYTWTDDMTSMGTYDSMIRIKAPELVEAILRYAPAEEIAELFEFLVDPQLEVTGGELVKVGDTLYLVFGQDYVGQYFTFGDQGKRPNVQAYTEQIRAIEMVPGKYQLLDISSLSQNNPREFHRRDLNVKMTKDASTGETVVGIYGGVFKDGGPGGFEHPIIFDPKKATISVCYDGVQTFNAYACATIGIWAEKEAVMSQVFFGGIGKGVYHPHLPIAGLDNDGMPYVSDISVLTQRYDGSWNEFVLAKPTPRNQLIGANSTFFINPLLRKEGWISDEEIILLDEMPKGHRILIGWIFGGIWAGQPQPPKHPIPGSDAVPTMASDGLIEVFLTPGTGSAIPVIS